MWQGDVDDKAILMTKRGRHLRRYLRLVTKISGQSRLFCIYGLPKSAPFEGYLLLLGYTIHFWKYNVIMVIRIGWEPSPYSNISRNSRFSLNFFGSFDVRMKSLTDKRNNFTFEIHSGHYLYCESDQNSDQYDEKRYFTTNLSHF